MYCMSSHDPFVIRELSGLLTSHFGEHYGEIFTAAHEEFPSFNILSNTKIIRSEVNDYLSGGLDVNGEPTIYMGIRSPLPQRVRERLVGRLALPIPATERFDPIFTPLAFAHEIGHVLQADENFSSVFGVMDHKVYIPEVDYHAYLHSEKETNADYIAACVIANTSIGRHMQMTHPDTPHQEWRTWVASRPPIVFSD